MDKYLTVILGSSVDIFYRVESYPQEGDFSHGMEVGKSAGGCALNVGCIAASKGAEVVALDYLKKGDEVTEILLNAMKENHVNTEYIIQAEDCTDGKVVIINSGDKRTMLVIDPKRPKYLVDTKMQELLNRSSYIYSLMHVVERSFDSYDYLKEARKHGAKMIFDGTSQYDDPKRSYLLLSLADGLFINSVDYQKLCNSIAQDAKEILFDNGCEFVCITEGSDGASCYTKDGKYHAESLVLENIVDSTGAGDAFAGAFLYGLLNELNYEKCLRLASVCGAYSCMHNSGLGGCCTVEELLAFAKEHHYEV